MPQKILLSTGQVAGRLGIARHQLTYRFERRQLPEPRRVCGRRAFTESDIQAVRDFFEERRAQRIAR